MKYIITLVLSTVLFFFQQQVYAQSSLTLSYDAKKIKEMYDIMQKVPDAAEVHQRYIKAFPANRDVFMEVFNSPQKDQLYDQSHSYILGMKQAATSYPDQVLYKCLLISADLKAWSKGPAEDLQNVIYDVALNNIDTFIVIIGNFKKSTTFNVAKFLAAHTNDTINPKFHELIALLEQRNQKRLLKLFHGALRR